MASPPTSSSLPDSSNVATTPEQQPQAESAPAFQWQAQDTTSLLPSQLPLTRAPRAWERKPLSPFSRQKMRVGKVWKRQAPVEIRAKRKSALGGAAKPVKKMKLEGGMALASRDEEEEEGSPVRKGIVTRSQGGETLELEEGDEGQEVEEEGAVVEIFDESGGVLDVALAEVDAQEEWEDDGEFEPTMMHLADMIREGKEQTAVAMDEEDSAQVLEDPGPVAEDAEVVLADTRDLDSDQEQTAPNDENLAPEPENTTLSQRKARDVALPEGFVSPVKRSARPERKTARSSLGSRRRTLPKEWRPSLLKQVLTYQGAKAYDRAMAAQEAAANAPPEVIEEVLSISPENTTAMVLDPALEAEGQAGSENVWEDVDEGSHTLDEAATAVHSTEVEANEVDADATDTSLSAGDSDQAQDMDLSITSQQDASEHTNLGNVPSSPIPTIDGQHPRLPLRRSPRRKSSSPVKQKRAPQSSDTSHLVAFTPIKSLNGFPHFPMTSPLGSSAEGDSTDDTTPTRLERSVSAPPEEPQMSPQRQSRPRISDDTALLQAFLNRAAETKSSARRVSASKKESITNRRDSDAVRQALASPVKPEVLAEMDPNSPSPRKPPVAQDEAGKTSTAQEAESSPVQQKTRRSNRATRKAAPQTATPAAAAPNKISIRRESEGVVLKKSEAQELSQLTRTNTRRNKGGSVLPLYRLSKMQDQGVSDPLDDGTVEAEETLTAKPNSKGRTLKWNETLVEFYRGDDAIELSSLADESGADMANATAGEGMDVDTEAPAEAPPPPAETPSKPKPKIRRLKAPRTAATPGKAASGPSSAAPSEPEQAEKPTTAEASAQQTKAPAPAKRRSRIATPAKGLSNKALLPSDVEQAAPAPATAPSVASAQPAAPPQHQQQQKKSLPTSSTRRKAPTGSKLPAPASLSASTSSTSAVSNGKENLIASPPKKKPAPSTGSLPSAKNFTPKLDFNGGKGIGAFPAGGQEDTGMSAPGIGSPAKKAGKRGLVGFGNGGVGGEETREREREEVVPPGLRSPAKKRTRRAVGGA